MPLCPWQGLMGDLRLLPHQCQAGGPQVTPLTRWGFTGDFRPRFPPQHLARGPQAVPPHPAGLDRGLQVSPPVMGQGNSGCIPQPSTKPGYLRPHPLPWCQARGPEAMPSHPWLTGGPQGALPVLVLGWGTSGCSPHPSARPEEPQTLLPDLGAPGRVISGRTPCYSTWPGDLRLCSPPSGS